jgi:L-amino acid N-acyltransferase YncA
MNEQLLVRPALPSDLPAVAAIYDHAVLTGTASYELEPPGLEEMIRRHEAIAGAGYPYLVAEREGRVVGYAYASAFRPRPAYRFIVEDSIYVDEAARGSGVGTALLAALIGEVEQLGFRQIIAVIGDGRPDSASVALHGRLGFREAGRLQGSGYKHDRWLDTLFMQLSLNGGDTLAPDPGSLAERRHRANG